MEEFMRHLFIINPAAGSKNRTESYSEEIHRICRKKHLNYDIRVSTAPGECTRFAREAAETGEEHRLYACGGDGTLNEVVQGAAGYPNVAVTVFSGGSGNDFVKLFNDPSAFFVLERLLDAEEATFDLIRCNEDLSLNICSLASMTAFFFELSASFAASSTMRFASSSAEPILASAILLRCL